jgi:hypothetical protein
MGLDGITFQAIQLFITTAVRTSNILNVFADVFNNAISNSYYRLYSVESLDDRE